MWRIGSLFFMIGALSGFFISCNLRNHSELAVLTKASKRPSWGKSLAGLDAGIEFYAETGQTLYQSGQYKENQFVYGGHLGVRYALSKNFALLAETGYLNISSLKLGATFTFNLQ